jgi:pimeloyl-ACP methyl ester carboxylesterase
MDRAGVPTRPHPLFRRIVLGLLLLVLLLAAAGFVYENIAEARDHRFNPMAGKLIVVDGRQMHIDCTGEGSPTVVLDSGLGDTYLSWKKVQPEISKFTRVCSYDRAGLGYSDSIFGARTSKVIAEQLHALLLAAGVAPPYILVGHSMGGYNVRLYANLYPAEVAGMVLVDSSHPEQDKRMPPELKNMQGSWMREAEFVEFSMPFGIPRLMGLCEDDPQMRAAECNWHSAHEGLAEMKAFSESAAETQAAGSLGNIPLVVVSHDPNKPSSELPPDLAKPMNDAWEKMQEELSHLSPRGTQIIAKNSSHYIQWDRPEVVADAVRSVVQQVRELPNATLQGTR